MNYEQNLSLFEKYIDSLKNEIYHDGEFTSELEHKIANHKMELIQNKINHTLRTVKDIAKVATNMNMNVDFVSIVKYTALLHDYGRFEQACRYNHYVDTAFSEDKFTVVKNGITLPVKNHAQFGYKRLFNENQISKNFEIESNLYNIIGESVFYHGDPYIPDHLIGDVENSITSGYLNKINYYQKNLNESEKILATTVLMLMQDVDKIDILFQSTFGEIPVVRDFVCVSETSKGINYLVDKYGVSKEEIIETNKLLSDNIKECEYIKIPLKNANLEALRIPDDIREKLLNQEHIPLYELTSRKEHNFIAAMWWKLSEFVNNMHFTSTLEVMKNKGLLDDIYDAYPDEYKFLVEEIFDFVKTVLIEQKLKESGDKILCSSLRK